MILRRSLGILGGGALAFAAGVAEEHVFMLGVAPFALGYGLSRSWRGLFGETWLARLALILLLLCGVRLGQYHMAEALWSQQGRLELTEEGLVQPASEGDREPMAFDMFLKSEVGLDGYVGFVALRTGSGLRLYGWGEWNRGIGDGALLGLFQLLLEGCLLGIGLGRIRACDLEANAKDFEQEAKGK